MENVKGGSSGNGLYTVRGYL